MIGMFGMGDNDATWLVVAVIDLNGEEPNWERIETAIPLDPMFPLDDYARRKPSAHPYICRDWGRRGTYQVRLAKDKLHYVSVTTDAERKASNLLHLFGDRRRAISQLCPLQSCSRAFGSATHRSQSAPRARFGI